MLLFSLFSESEQKIRQCCRNCIHRVQRNFPKNFYKSVTVSIFSDFEQSFWGFTEHFSTGLSKLLFKCSEDLHGTEFFSNKQNCIISIIAGLWAKRIHFRLEKFWQHCQNCISCVQRNILRIFFPGIVVLVPFCGIWSKTVWAFLGKPLIGSLKWNSVCRD